jgi:hypothetical protein
MGRARQARRQIQKRVETGQASDLDGQPASQVTHYRERERPNPSSIWMISAFSFLTSAVGTSVAALTVAADAAVRTSELWVATGGLLLAATLCLAANWDVNRGRRSRYYEIEKGSEKANDPPMT